MGYALDHFVGDGEYSGEEAFVDAATGAIGGGLVNPLVKVGSRANKVIKYGGDDAVKVVTKTDQVMVAGYVTAPMVSAPVRRELVGGVVAGFAYDIATQSPGSRSERNASKVGSGGNTPGQKRPMLSDASIRWNLKNGYSMHATTEHACGLGYRLVKRKGKYVCVKR